MAGFSTPSFVTTEFINTAVALLGALGLLFGIQKGIQLLWGEVVHWRTSWLQTNQNLHEDTADDGDDYESDDLEVEDNSEFNE